MLAHSSPIRRSNPAGICFSGQEDAPQLLSSTSSARVTITANALQTAAPVSKTIATGAHPCQLILPYQVTPDRGSISLPDLDGITEPGSQQQARQDHAYFATFRNGHPCAMGVLPQSDDQHDLRLVRAIRV
ncbi:hypothetical protein BDZ85DRAFT_111269 [Elsinoe ampelina]|uniref:Uncharacterized protein n=1 Tax=Elsinoe ampelina TaxID=302913 RepID=A0A6A6GCV6_9PEZI|nr:hypothetical protein BDZ85DRAFT_111269 [Elsinoe ampelina]